jgi:pimeloyl-ACP methyl ester carboxylesterase
LLGRFHAPSGTEARICSSALIEETTIEVDGVRTFVRRKPGEGPPAVFVHGNPTHSEDWMPFLERLEGPAVALDLPGWGRSERPDRASFDQSMHGLGSFFGRFLDTLGIGEHRLVVHDWGVVALLAAQRHPERVRRLVVINAVPLLPGYRWHWVARLWRRRGVGELVNATTTRAGTALLLRQATADRRPMPDEFVDMIWRHLDGGTRRAILELYRSAPEEALAAAGSRLDALNCPALVVWGARDPYLPVKFGRAYARRLPGAQLMELEDAGHWPWVERPDVVERVTGFLQVG